jgi:hypothetical protein
MFIAKIFVLFRNHRLAKIRVNELKRIHDFIQIHFILGKVWIVRMYIQQSPKIVFSANYHHQSFSWTWFCKGKLHCIDTIQFDLFHFKQLRNKRTMQGVIEWQAYSRFGCHGDFLFDNGSEFIHWHVIDGCHAIDLRHDSPTQLRHWPVQHDRILRMRWRINLHKETSIDNSIK